MSRQALEMALETLERCVATCFDQRSHDQVMGRPEHFVNQTITAIKEALAQPEPVAWKNAALRVGEDLCSVGPFGYYDMTAEQWLDWALSVVTVHAPPAQRTWVGLTDEEIAEFAERMEASDPTDSFWREFSRAIEAKLKDKNEN